MRYKEIDINIKAIPEPEDEAILNQLIGNKKASVSTDAEETPTTNNSNTHNTKKKAHSNVCSSHFWMSFCKLERHEARQGLDPTFSWSSGRTRHTVDGII